MKIILHADEKMAAEIPTGQVGMKQLSAWEWELEGAPSVIRDTLDGLRPCSWRAMPGVDTDDAIMEIFHS